MTEVFIYQTNSFISEIKLWINYIYKKKYHTSSNNRESSFIIRISLEYFYFLKTILEAWTLIEGFIFIKIFTFCLLSKVL